MAMTVLVAYASKHGATQEIAGQIVQSLSAAGRDAEARSVREAAELGRYEAVVLGSATYRGHWLGQVRG